MRTVHYHSVDTENNTIYAKKPHRCDEGYLQDCINITMKYNNEEYDVYLTEEDATHFAKTIRELAADGTLTNIDSTYTPRAPYFNE